MLDPPPLQAYMSRWDGPVFFEAADVGNKSVLDVGIGTGRVAYHGNTHSVSKPNEDIAIWNVDREEQMQREYDQVTREVSRLSRMQGRSSKSGTWRMRT